MYNKKLNKKNYRNGSNTNLTLEKFRIVASATETNKSFKGLLENTTGKV